MLFCWIVSNWNEKHKWVKYYNELKNHIEMYAFGRHFGKVVSGAIYDYDRKAVQSPHTRIGASGSWGSMIHIRKVFSERCFHPREGFLQPSETG